MTPRLMSYENRDSLEEACAGYIVAHRKRFGLEPDDAQTPLLRKLLGGITTVGDDHFAMRPLDVVFDAARLTENEREYLEIRRLQPSAIDPDRARRETRMLRELADNERKLGKLEQAVADGDLDRVGNIVRKPTATSKPRVRRAWQRFPVDALPFEVRQWVLEHARTMGVDPSMLAMPLLGAIAGFIGNTLAVRKRHDWVEPLALWVGMVAQSGSKKSPAMKKAMQHFRKRQSVHFKETAAANKGKAADDHAKPPRRFVDDATPEAIFAMLAENPRGLLAHRDELAEWLAGFGRFKSGKTAGLGEASQACKLYDASPHDVDRRSTGHAHIPKPLLSVVGAIPPKTLRTLFLDAYKANGLFPRFALYQPPTKPGEYSEADVDWRLDLTLYELVARIDGLRLDFDPATDEPTPTELTLDADASERWKAEYNRLQRLAFEQGDGLAASATSKTAGLLLRIAGIVHAVETLLDPELRKLEPSDAIAARPTIADGTMARAIEVGNWIHDERLRVFAKLEVDAETDQLADMVDGIDWGRFPRGVTGKELYESRKGSFAGSDEAETRLREAVKIGLLAENWGVRGDAAKGGRETLYFTPTRSCASETRAEAD